MAQVTIYLEEEALQHVKAAAAAANLSVSKWFAQIALKTSAQTHSDRAAFWQRIDTLRHGQNDDGLDFLLDPVQRHADLGQDYPRADLD